MVRSKMSTPTCHGDYPSHEPTAMRPQESGVETEYSCPECGVVVTL